MLSEAIRGIFDGRQFNRAFSIYYYYAKYVIREACWAGMVKKCGITRTAGKIIETFNRLNPRQQEIFISEALQFHKDHQIYAHASTLASPKRKYFPEEPKLPPRNAQQIYNSESRLRIRETGERFTPWARLDEKSQMIYLKKLYRMNREYVSMYEQFIKNMTPNDMVQYIVGRCQEWEKLRRKAPYTYNDKLVDAACPMFASETFRAELSDDGQESEPEVYELNGSITNPMDSALFKYKQNPFGEKKNQVNKFVENKQNLKNYKVMLRKQRAAQKLKVDSDVPSSDDECDDLVIPGMKYRREKQLKAKIRKLQTYYYPLEDLYDFSAISEDIRRESLKGREEAKAKAPPKRAPAKSKKLPIVSVGRIKETATKQSIQKSVITNKLELGGTPSAAAKILKRSKNSKKRSKVILPKFVPDSEDSESSEIENGTTRPEVSDATPVTEVLSHPHGTNDVDEEPQRMPSAATKILKASKKPKRSKVILPKFVPDSEDSESSEIENATTRPAVSETPQVTEVLSHPHSTKDLDEEPERMPSLVLVAPTPHKDSNQQSILSAPEETINIKDESDKVSVGQQQRKRSVAEVVSSLGPDTSDFDAEKLDVTEVKIATVESQLPEEITSLDFLSQELFPAETVEEECDPYASIYLEDQFMVEEVNQYF